MDQLEVMPVSSRVVCLNAPHLKSLCVFEALSRTLGCYYNHHRLQVCIRPFVCVFESPFPLVCAFESPSLLMCVFESPSRLVCVFEFPSRLMCMF